MEKVGCMGQYAESVMGLVGIKEQLGTGMKNRQGGQAQLGHRCLGGRRADARRTQSMMVAGKETGDLADVRVEVGARGEEGLRRGGNGGCEAPSISPSTPFASHLAQMRHTVAFAQSGQWGEGE